MSVPSTDCHNVGKPNGNIDLMVSVIAPTNNSPIASQGETVIVAGGHCDHIGGGSRYSHFTIVVNPPGHNGPSRSPEANR